MPRGFYTRPHYVDRVLAKVKVHPLGCWEYTGKLKRDGYAAVWTGSASMQVHRAVYFDFVGPVPDGLVLDHLCMNKRCVNPAHLEPVTTAENTRRAAAAGLMKQQPASHCKRGHPLSGDNLYVRPRGYPRECRICKNKVLRGRS